MIFVGGIHGVGKTFLCSNLSDIMGIPHYSSSELISFSKKEQFGSNKEAEEINNNQNYLFYALDSLNLRGGNFILDGHFCLLSKESMISKIPLDTFYKLSPASVVLLKGSPRLIAERLFKRDGKEYKSEFLERFQNEELTYAKVITNYLNVPFHIFDVDNGKLEILVQEITNNKEGAINYE